MSSGYEASLVWKGASAPATAGQGDIWVNQTTNEVFVHSGLRFAPQVFPSGIAVGTGALGATNRVNVATAYSGTGGAVMADFVFDTTSTASADLGGLRTVARQLATGNAQIRALEAHVVRDGAASSNTTWGIEVGVHSSVAGDGTSRNLGLYVASSHTGWTATGVRADVGVLITGEDGWTHGIRYLDTDGTTLLFNVNQSGLVRALGLTMATGDVTLTAGSIRMNGSGQIIDFSAVVTGTIRCGSTALAVQNSGGTQNILVVGNDGVTTVAASTATPAAGSTAARLLFGTTAGFGIYYGSNAPTVSAAQGSLYLRSDGSSGSTRLYINSSSGSGTTWTNVTTAA